MVVAVCQRECLRGRDRTIQIRADAAREPLAVNKGIARIVHFQLVEVRTADAGPTKGVVPCRQCAGRGNQGDALNVQREVREGCPGGKAG